MSWRGVLVLSIPGTIISKLFKVGATFSKERQNIVGAAVVNPVVAPSSQTQVRESVAHVFDKRSKVLSCEGVQDKIGTVQFGK